MAPVCSKDTNRRVGVFCYLENHEFVAIVWGKYIICVNLYRRCMIKLMAFN